MPQRSTTIRRSLMSITLLTSGAVMLFAALSFSAYEFVSSRQSTLRQLATLTQAIASNSTAALAFGDSNDAHEVLSAFKAEPHVTAAALFNHAGAVLALYPSGLTRTALPLAPGPDGFRFSAGDVLGFQPVMLDGRSVGTLYVKSDLGEVYQRMRLNALIALAVMALGALVAYLVSNRLQRRLSRPILALAGAAEAVSGRRDYGVRAAPGGVTELDTLTEAFNQMLDEVQYSEARLRDQLGRLRLLQDITRAIGERLDPRSIFQVVVGSLEESLPIDFGCVCLYTAAPEALTVTTIGAASHTFGVPLGLTERDNIPVDRNGLSRCVAGELVYEPDVQKVDFPFPQRLARAGLRSLVISPLIVESKVFGVLIAARRAAEAFSSPECEFLRQLSEHVALATHQAQLYGALQQAYEDLRQSQQAVMRQERLRALGEMASGIAHDINNAISPVSLYTDSILEREPNLSERLRSYLTTIQSAIQDVGATVARMREFYRQREPELTLVRIELNQAVEQVLQLTHPRWRDQPQQRGVVIELRKELEASLPAVMGAESEIRDALTNLIFNAVDAMPQGGQLTVRTRSWRTDDHTQQVCVEVADTGIGMDEETRRRCLEPFFTTKGARGTGMGLAMVYGMVQRHSAELEIDSAVGRGTTVRLIFASYAQLAEAPRRPDSPQLAGRRLRILIVDDDPMLIKSLQDTLEGDGHAITAASGGQAGIDAFAAAQRAGKPFEVVVTDLGMPHVDGRKVAASVKASSPQTPVIMLTGWGQRLTAENDIPPYVDRVLNKPPRLQQLRAALAELMAPARQKMPA